MPLSISADAMSSPRRCGGTDDTWYPARRRSMPEPTAGHRGDTRAWHPASQGRFGHAAERHGVRALMAADGRDPVLCSLWSVERSELEQPSVWRRMRKRSGPPGHWVSRDLPGSGEHGRYGTCRGRIGRGWQRGVARASAQTLFELCDAGLQPSVRLDQLIDSHQQGQRRLPVAVEYRLRLGTFHSAGVRRTQEGPCSPNGQGDLNAYAYGATPMAVPTHSSPRTTASIARGRGRRRPSGHERHD